MSRPIALSDDELSAVMIACRQLQPRDRDRFLKGVAQAIAELPERGPGSVHRAIDRVEGVLRPAGPAHRRAAVADHPRSDATILVSASPISARVNASRSAGR